MGGSFVVLATGVRRLQFEYANFFRWTRSKNRSGLSGWTPWNRGESSPIRYCLHSNLYSTATFVKQSGFNFDRMSFLYWKEGCTLNNYRSQMHFQNSNVLITWTDLNNRTCQTPQSSPFNPHLKVFSATKVVSPFGRLICKWVVDRAQTDTLQLCNLATWMQNWHATSCLWSSSAFVLKEWGLFGGVVVWGLIFETFSTFPNLCSKTGRPRSN